MATVAIIIEDQPGGKDVGIHYRSDAEPDTPPTAAEQAGMFMVSMVSMFGEVEHPGDPTGGMEL